MIFLVSKLGKYIMISAIMLSLAETVPGGEAIEKLILTTKTEVSKIDFQKIAKSCIDTVRDLIEENEVKKLDLGD